MADPKIDKKFCSDDDVKKSKYLLCTLVSESRRASVVDVFYQSVTSSLDVWEYVEKNFGARSDVKVERLKFCWSFDTFYI